MVISLPLYIEIGIKKKKKYYLNLNGYRNWAFILSNNLKKKYTDIVLPLLKDIDNLDRIKLIYTIYYPTQRNFDVDNIGAISGKFFQDTLTKSGKIKDDNYKYIPEITYKVGGIDRVHPRVEVEIIKY